MEPVTNLVLSAVVSLTTAFSDGLKAVEQKDYEKAIVALSRVVEDKTPENPLKPLALFYRAQSYLAKKDAKAAKADIVALVESVDGGILYDSAVALMKEAGGSEKDLMPREDPERVWCGFIDDMAGQRIEEAKQRCTGQWLSQLDGFARGGMGGEQYAESLRSFQIAELRFGLDKERGKAWLSMSAPNAGWQQPPMQLEFVRVRNKWLISMWSQARRIPAAAAEKVTGDRSNFARLRAISLALMAYAKDHKGAFPARFGDLLGQYVKDASALMWQGPDAGKGVPFLYCAGLTNTSGGASILVAEPVPGDGRRDVVYSNGRVGGVSEAEFKEAAASQKWEIPDKPGVSKVTQQTIDGLVEQLRRGGTVERKKARKELGDLGVDAYPLLEKYRKDDDPEVLETMKEIFGKK